MFAKSVFASFRKFSIYIRIIYFSQAQLYSKFQITPKTNLLNTRLLQKNKYEDEEYQQIQSKVKIQSAATSRIKINHV